ncbi:hypothetical protein [Blastococcus sp. VKM Ac-2987]|uniref:hypothetical protein n=1 Tax=Blastococcus sp. VKM Ac-2987 TaxID=3004141 RepID=UPI0022AB8E37|nr:hypothetical protein [Blastococcus sp. VKM Ac-2987]MCZ2858083.1 hypothetical protein [Blastococcus sp. VKM Ac-2987]
MRRRSPAQARFLGLWTAGWLAVLLVVGMVRFGDPAVQWPVLVVPAVWALVACRPRRPSRGAWEERHRADRAGGERWTGGDGWTDEHARAGDGRPDDRWDDRTWDDDRWDDGTRDDGTWDDDARRWPAPGERTDTVERPALRRRSDGTGERW